MALIPRTIIKNVCIHATQQCKKKKSSTQTRVHVKLNGKQLKFLKERLISNTHSSLKKQISTNNCYRGLK